MPLDLQNLRTVMHDNGVTRILIKRLAPNDNSKNQPYFGPDLTSIGFLPTGKVTTTATKSDKPKKSEVKFLVDLDFYWIVDGGVPQKAPHAKLIYYPQYPEVRFSGFLRGCAGAPNELMDPCKRGREPGRVLFLGVSSDNKLIGYLADQSSEVARQLGNLGDLTTIGVFDQLPMGYQTGHGDSRTELLREICRISSRQWINSKRLTADGIEIEYRANNGGGFTLEAELGITPNGISEPDFHGWEVKQFRVSNLDRGTGGRITLMTPEPVGGIYKSAGLEEFVLRFGYPDTKGRDRRNFCGVHKYGLRQPRTGLTMTMPGFNIKQMQITDPSKGLTLVDDAGEEAAVWSYSNIVEHWKRKHAKAAYVPAVMRRHPGVQYRYSSIVRLGEGTGVTKLLTAIAKGDIIYDPGVIMKNASTTMRPLKRRSQFRVTASNLAKLYDSFSLVDACESAGTSLLNE